jgi:hypothetical protein
VSSLRSCLTTWSRRRKLAIAGWIVVFFAATIVAWLYRPRTGVAPSLDRVRAVELPQRFRSFPAIGEVSWSTGMFGWRRRLSGRCASFEHVLAWRFERPLSRVLQDCGVHSADDLWNVSADEERYWAENYQLSGKVYAIRLSPTGSTGRFANFSWTQQLQGGSSLVGELVEGGPG